jgi:hypothetical protein
MWKSSSICQRFITDPVTQSLLKMDDPQEFDYILVSPHFTEECVLAFVHLHQTRFGTPWGYVFSTMTLPWANAAMGNPDWPSTWPLAVLGYSDRMTFWERCVNWLLTKYSVWMRWYVSYPRVEAVLRKEYDAGLGSLAQLERSSSLYLVNIDEGVFHYPQVMGPQTVLAAGAHCRDPKPLPKVFRLIFYNIEYIVFERDIYIYRKSTITPNKNIRNF